MDTILYYSSYNGNPVTLGETLFGILAFLFLLSCFLYIFLSALFNVNYDIHVNYFKFRKSAKAFGFPKKITYSMYRDWYYKCYDPLIAKCYHDCFLNFLASKGDDSNA